MADKNGKDIKVGDIVKHSDGSRSRVVGVIKTALSFRPASGAEVVDEFIGGKCAMDADDCIVWGT
jgi:hypothetical protein